MAQDDPTPRDAVIWIGGLGDTDVAQSLPRTAKRLAVALENESHTAVSFAVSAPAKRPRDEDAIPMCTIVRTDPDGERPVIDLFGLGVHETLMRPVLAMALWKQALLGGGVVLGAGIVLFNSLVLRSGSGDAPPQDGEPQPAAADRRRGPHLKPRKGKSPREQLQIAYVILLLVVMVAAFVVLLAAVAATLEAGSLDDASPWLGTAILGFGGMAVWRSAAAKRLRAAGLVLYAVYRYIERADNSGASLRGQLAKALDAVQTHAGETPYERIVVMAYSFGSMAAMDACFSPTAAPSRRIADIDRLVTIGCPFDLIRAFRPEYAGARFGTPPEPGWWTNVYAPSDVLSSNFRNDDEPGQPLVALPLREPPGATALPGANLVYRIDGRDRSVGLRDGLLLRGLQFHAQYWSEADEDAESVFGALVPLLFLGRPSLAQLPSARATAPRLTAPSRTTAQLPPSS